MDNNITTTNAARLASLSASFCALNGITVNAEIAAALSDAVLAACHQWYMDNGKSFDPCAEIIEEEAIKYAFKRMQQIATMATLAAMVGMES